MGPQYFQPTSGCGTQQPRACILTRQQDSSQEVYLDQHRSYNPTEEHIHDHDTNTVWQHLIQCSRRIRIHEAFPTVTTHTTAIPTTETESGTDIVTITPANVDALRELPHLQETYNTHTQYPDIFDKFTTIQ